MAFDRAALLKDMSNGYGAVTTQVFPPNSPGYEKSLESYYRFDPAKAKQLLAEAAIPTVSPWPCRPLPPRSARLPTR